MNRATENALALVAIIAVPAALLWLIGLAYGALQEAQFWRSWSEEGVAALWLGAVIVGLGVVLYLVRQLLRMAQAWSARSRSSQR